MILNDHQPGILLVDGVLLDFLSQRWSALGNLIRIILYDTEWYSGPIGSRTKANSCVIIMFNHINFFNQRVVNVCFLFRAYKKFLMTWSNFIRLCGKSLRKLFSRWQPKEALSLIKASLWTSILLSLTMANLRVCTSMAGSRFVEEIKEVSIDNLGYFEIGTEFYILLTY